MFSWPFWLPSVPTLTFGNLVISCSKRAAAATHLTPILHILHGLWKRVYNTSQSDCWTTDNNTFRSFSKHKLPIHANMVIPSSIIGRTPQTWTQLKYRFAILWEYNCITTTRLHNMLAKQLTILRADSFTNTIYQFVPKERSPCTVDPKVTRRY